MAAIDRVRGLRREKFMGAAEQVGAGTTPAPNAPPALERPMPTGRANGMGSGSAPLGTGRGPSMAETGVKGAGVAKALVPPAEAPGLAMRGLAAAGKGLGAVGGGLGAYFAGKDIYDNGLGASNAVDLGTSVAGGVGAVLSAPVAVGAGSLAVGKALGQRVTPDPVALGLARSVESLGSPVQTFNRMRAGGPFLRPETGGIAGPNLEQRYIDAANARNLGGRPVVPTIAQMGTGAPQAPGQAQALSGLRQPGPVTPMSPPAIESLDPNSARGRQASANLNSRGFVPASGTGIMRNNTTGAVTQFNAQPQQQQDPAAREAQMRAAYATSPTLAPDHLPPSLQRELPSALATFQRAVKSGNPSDIIAAKAGLREDAASKVQDATTDRLGMTLDSENARSRATLSQGAKIAGLTARQKQMQDDREFGLKQQELGLRAGEFGAKRDNEDFAQRQAGQKNLVERYSSQFRTPEGKVDDARVAKFSTGVQTFLGNKTSELTDKVAAGKATEQEIRMLADIKRKGVSALDEEDLTAIETNIKRGERAMQTKSMLGGSQYVESNDPSAYDIVGQEQNLFGSDTVKMRNGSSARKNDLRFTEPGNAILPNAFKTETDTLLGLRGRKK